MYTREIAYGLLDGKLWTWNDGVLRQVSAVPDVHLGGLFATGLNEVWAYDIPTGIDHFAYFYSESGWRSYWIGSMDTPNDIWVASGGDLIMHYDGSAWTSYGNLPNVRVKGLSGYPGTPPMFVCDEDFVFKYAPAAE